MDIQRLPADSPSEVLVDALERDGAVIVEDLLDADLLARFNAELDPFIEAAPPGEGPCSSSTTRSSGSSARRPVTSPASPASHGCSRPRSSPTRCTEPSATRSCCRAARRTSSTSRTCSTVVPGSEQQLIHRDEVVWVHLPQPAPRGAARVGDRARRLHRRQRRDARRPRQPPLAARSRRDRRTSSSRPRWPPDRPSSTSARRSTAAAPTSRPTCAGAGCT